MPPEQAQTATPARDVSPDKPKENTRAAGTENDPLRAEALTPPLTAGGRRDALADARPAVLRTNEGIPDFELVDLSATQGKPDAPNPTIDQKARAIKEALDHRNLFGYGLSDPQTENIRQILDPLTPAERKAVEKRYQELFDPSHPFDETNSGGGKMRADLAAKLGADSAPFRQIEAMLERKAGTTNDAGQAMEALAKIAKDRLAGEAELRGVLATLNASDTARLQREFEQKYGKTLGQAMKDAKVSPETTAYVEIFSKGADKRTAEDIASLANLAMDGSIKAKAELSEKMKGSGRSPSNVSIDISKPYKELLKDILGGSSPAAVQARRQLQSDPEFEKKFGQAFNDNKGKPDSSLRDYITAGGVSLSTIIEKNVGKPLGFMLDNPESVTLATENVTEAERTNYAKGRNLVGRENDLNLSDADKAALDYYKRTRESLTLGAGDKPWLADSWEANILYGKDNVIAQLAATHRGGILEPFGLGRSHTAEDILSVAENLSDKDWQRLRAESKENPPVGKFREDIARSLDTYAPAEKERILALLDAKTKAATHAEAQQVKRDFVSLVGDNRTSGFLGTTTREPAKIIDGIVNLSAEELRKYKSDDAFSTQVDQLVSQSLDGPSQLLAKRLLEKALVLPEGEKLKPDAIDQVLLDRAHNAPLDIVMEHIQAAYQAKDASGQTLFERVQSGLPLSAEDRLLQGVIQAQAGPLLNDYSLPVVQKLGRREPMADVYAAAVNAPEEEQNALRRLLTPEQRQVLDVAIAQKREPSGPLRLEDKIRSFALGDNANPELFKRELASLTEPEKVELKKVYATKYGSESKPADLDKDLLCRLDKSKQVEFTNLLSTGARDSRQSFYDNLRNYLGRTGVTVDGTENNMERAVKQQQDALEQYQRVYQTMPKEKQQLLDEYFNKSFEQYKDSKEKLSDMAVDAAITATALAAAPFSAGMSVGVIAAMSGGGAAFRLAAKAAMEGSDFDSSGPNVLKELVNGAAATALNFIGAKEIDSLVISAQKAGTTFGEYLVKHGVSEATAKAAGVAAGINMEAVAGGAVGAAMNVGTEVVMAPLNGQAIDWNTLWQSAQVGFAMGAVIPVTIKGLQGLGHGTDTVVNVVRGKNSLNFQSEVNPNLAATRNGRVLTADDGEGVPLDSTVKLVETDVVDNVLVDKNSGKPLVDQQGYRLDGQHRRIEDIPPEARAEAVQARKLYSRRASGNPDAPLVDANDIFEQWRPNNAELDRKAKAEVAARDAFEDAQSSGAGKDVIDAAKTARDNAVKSTSEILNLRGAQLESRVNNALAAEGLPSIKVEVADALDGDASFSFEGGKPTIKIARRALIAGSEAKLQELINHEADHYLQVALEGRRVRELAEAGGPPLDPNKPADVKRFAETYAKHLQMNEGGGPRGGLPSEDYLQSLMKKEPLTEEQRALADRLIVAAKSGAPVRADSIETAILLSETNKQKAQLEAQLKANERTGVFNHNIIDEILDPSNSLLTRREWDQNPNFTAEKIDEIRRTFGSAITSIEAKNASARELLDIISRRSEDLSAFREKAERQYNGLHQIDELYADVAGGAGRATAGDGTFTTPVADDRVYDVGPPERVDGRWSRSGDGPSVGNEFASRDRADLDLRSYLLGGNSFEGPRVIDANGNLSYFNQNGAVRVEAGVNGPLARQNPHYQGDAQPVVIRDVMGRRVEIPIGESGVELRPGDKIRAGNAESPTVDLTRRPLAAGDFVLDSYRGLGEVRSVEPNGDLNIAWRDAGIGAPYERLPDDGKLYRPGEEQSDARHQNEDYANPYPEVARAPEPAAAAGPSAERIARVEQLKPGDQVKIDSQNGVVLSNSNDVGVTIYDRSQLNSFEQTPYRGFERDIEAVNPADSQKLQDLIEGRGDRADQILVRSKADPGKQYVVADGGGQLIARPRLESLPEGWQRELGRYEYIQNDAQLPGDRLGHFNDKQELIYDRQTGRYYNLGRGGVTELAPEFRTYSREQVARNGEFPALVAETPARQPDVPVEPTPPVVPARPAEAPGAPISPERPRQSVPYGPDGNKYRLNDGRIQWNDAEGKIWIQEAPGEPFTRRVQRRDRNDYLVNDGWITKSDTDGSQTWSDGDGKTWTKKFGEAEFSRPAPADSKFVKTESGVTELVDAHGNRYRLVMGANRFEKVPFRFGDKEVLMQYNQGFYYVDGKTRFPGAESPIKVHVSISDSADLSRIQQALIPELLNENSELARYVAGFKTENPLNGIESENAEVLGKAQRAKAFTIYSNTPEDAAKVAELVDKFLKEKGLSVQAPLNTGNVDGLRGETGRVGVVRDTFILSKDSTERRPLAALDGELQRQIEQRYRVSPAASNKDQILRQIEQEIGIRPNLLSYDSRGQLIVEVPYARNAHDYHDGVYAAEGAAFQEFGHYFGRRALYELYQKFNLDPASYPLEILND